MTQDRAAAAAGSRLSHWFANAAATEPTTSFLDSVWLSRIVFTLQTLAVPLAFWFKPLCVGVALFWLIYRASQILNQPLELLSSTLGFDIPSNPSIDLANIKADGAVIHWRLPERPKSKSQLKYEIHLNGTVIDAVSYHESAVTITGLQPASFYIVRVAVVHNEFCSKSPAIRFRTKPAESGDFFNNGSTDGHETETDSIHESMPRVRPYRALKDFSPASPACATMTRELSAGLGPGRNTSRRPSPAVLDLPHKHDPHPRDSEPPEGAESIQQLTEKLDSIRGETEEAERHAKEEEDEEFRQKEELAKERDELKTEANEKEKASRNLKREVNTLERQNTAAQNERAKHERMLQQKRQDRQKLDDDMVRWERGAEEMKAEVERISRDKVAHLERVEKEKENLRQKSADESAKHQVLDDEYKQKTAEVKKLERTLKNGPPSGSHDVEPNLVQQLQNDAEEDRKWQIHRHNLHQTYTAALAKLDEYTTLYENQKLYLQTIRTDRRRQQEMAQYASPTLQDRLPRRADSQRNRQAQSRHSISDSPRMGAFHGNPSPFANNINAAPGGFNTSPFFNIQNGMTLAGPTDDVVMSEEDREKLTGGAPMSPSAGADLIPADLFSGEGDSRPEQIRPLPGLGSLPGLPGLPAPPEYPGYGPNSPAASSSRSQSVFASPQASQHNLHLGSPENIIDADRRSIRSTRSNRAPSGGASSRFSGMFGIKQRNKTVSEDGPPLGKASSMPRQDQGLAGLDSATRKRNSSISAWPADGALDGSAESPASAPGRRAFGLFSKDKSGGWPSTFTSFGRRPASPRPGSTHSNELPRPSMEGGRWGADAWASGDASAGTRGSPLAFGSGWNAPPPQQSRIYGSRHPSRRPSVQYAASGPPEDILEDEDSDALDPSSEPHLAPIGTKPSKKADNAAKLNPNAKDFKSFFSSMKFGGKDKSKDSADGSEGKDGTTPQGSNSTTPALGAVDIDESPPDSRKSRDTRSMTTTESSLAESGRNSPTSSAHPPIPTPTPPVPSPSLQGKESFMQKITRKSSSSKFSLPTFKREKSRLDALSASNTSTPVPAEEAGEEEGVGMSESVGSLREGKGVARSWSSAFKLGKKRGFGGGEVGGSDRVSTSGTEDGDGEEEE